MSAEIVRLSDAASGATAEILVSLGFNCFRWRAVCEGEQVAALWSHPEFTDGTQRPSGSGIPILFPFAGRIAGGVYRWQGKERRLETNDRLGNAIHGFAFNRPWRLMEASGASATAEFQGSADAPETLDTWPADYRLLATYTLAADSLRLELTMENPDDRPLPYLLGLHPYLRVPLGGPSAEECRLRVPVTEEWELKDLIPTGRRTAIERPWGWTEGQRFGDLKLDNVFSGLVFDASGRIAGELHDPGSSRTLRIEWGADFPEAVLFIPPHREAICIEPYSGCPNPFALAEAGIDPGLRILAPGESRQTSVTFRVLRQEEPGDDDLWRRVHRGAC
jgi:aldose 1-epimerase